MQQLSAQDAQFLYMESDDNLTHVTAVYIYDPSTAADGKVRFKDIIRHVESRLDASPVFTQLERDRVAPDLERGVNQCVAVRKCL